MSTRKIINYGDGDNPRWTPETPTDRPDSERFDEALRQLQVAEGRLQSVSDRGESTDFALRVRNERRSAVLAAFDAARTPLDQPDAVGEIVMFGRVVKEVAWRNGRMPPVGTKLGVLPFTASPDSVRREAFDVFDDVMNDCGISMGDRRVIVEICRNRLATKGQS